MTRDSSSSSYRAVTLEHIGTQAFTVKNARGGEMTIGEGQNSDFTPVELLLAALAGCNAITVEAIAMKRATPLRFRILADGHKIDDLAGSQLEDLRVVMDVEFREDEPGHKATERLPRALEQSHDRFCTVGRTVRSGVDTQVTLAGSPADVPKL